MNKLLSLLASLARKKPFREILVAEPGQTYPVSIETVKRILDKHYPDALFYKILPVDAVLVMTDGKRLVLKNISDKMGVLLSPTVYIYIAGLRNNKRVWGLVICDNHSPRIVEAGDIESLENIGQMLWNSLTKVGIEEVEEKPYLWISRKYTTTYKGIIAAILASQLAEMLSKPFMHSRIETLTEEEWIEPKPLTESTIQTSFYIVESINIPRRARHLKNLVTSFLESNCVIENNKCLVKKEALEKLIKLVQSMGGKLVYKKLEEEKEVIHA